MGVQHLHQLKNPIVESLEVVGTQSQEPRQPKRKKTNLTSNPSQDINGGFKVTENGIFLVTLGADDETPDKYEFVCGRLEVAALIRDPHSEQWGKILQWQDVDGRFHEWVMPMSQLQVDGVEVRRELAAGGLEIASQFRLRTALMTYLSLLKTPARALGVDKTGWHQLGDGFVFVLPDQSIGESSEIVRLLATSSSRAYALAGTFDGWKAEVAALCAGNSRCILALCTGFASMLLAFSGLESGGINLMGPSSTGKSTGLAAAASIFGGSSYINRWRSTTNGLESLAAMHNDTLLILDEMGQVDPKVVGEIAYMLANGQGKQRSARTGAAKMRQSWRLLFLSSGELGLAQHMADGGKRAKAGQEVRLVDVVADAGKNCGVFDTLHGHSAGADLSKSIQAGAARHHGHAAVAFAKALVASAAEMGDHIKQQMALFVEASLPEGKIDGQVHRVSERFALMAVAGELATTNGITGWQPGEAGQAIRRCFSEWLSARGGVENSEPAAMIEAVRSFISRHEESRFADSNIELNSPYRVTSNRAGWRRRVDVGYEYLIDPSVFKSEVCAGFDVTAVCKVLAQAGCLEPGLESGKTRYAVKRRIQGDGSRRVYVVSAKIWEA